MIPPTRKRSVVCFALFVAVAVVGTAPAGATWSVVGVDPTTREVGVAVASCVPIDAVELEGGFELTALSPGRGAGISQALFNPAARAEIQSGLDAGRAASEILATLTEVGFDTGAEQRQHGIVLLTGEAVGYTGSANGDVAVDKQGMFVAAQGNILVSEAVIDDAIAAFEADPAAALAARLVDALDAGSLAGGDARCGDQTALFAHVAVIDLEGTHAEPNIVDLTTAADEGSGINPVEQLAAAYRAGERFIRPARAGVNWSAGLVPVALLIGASWWALRRIRARTEDQGLS